MSPDLFKLFRKRDTAFSKYKATKSECHMTRYRTFRNKSVGALRKLSASSSIDFLHSSGLLSSSGLCITLSLLTGRGFLPHSAMALSLLNQRPVRPIFSLHTFPPVFLNPLTTTTAGVALSPLWPVSLVCLP